MNQFMNYIFVSGYLSSDVKSYYDESRKTTVAKFYLKNPVQVGHNKYGNDLYIIAYGKLAEECVAFLSKGIVCAVQGTFSTWNKADKNGGEQPGITVIAKDIIFNKNVEYNVPPNILEEHIDCKSDDGFCEDDNGE